MPGPRPRAPLRWLRLWVHRGIGGIGELLERFPDHPRHELAPLDKKLVVGQLGPTLWQRVPAHLAWLVASSDSFLSANCSGQYTAGAWSEMAMLSFQSTRAMLAIWLICLVPVMPSFCR